jgi:hypothetical protein
MQTGFKFHPIDAFFSRLIVILINRSLFGFGKAVDNLAILFIHCKKNRKDKSGIP